MSMGNQLPGLISRRSKSQSKYYVIQSAFQEDQKRFASDSFPLFSSFKVIGKLIFKHSVNALNLLFLAELHPIPNNFWSMISAVLSWRKVAFLDGAGIPEASVAFKEELHSLSSA